MIMIDHVQKYHYLVLFLAAIWYRILVVPRFVGMVWSVCSTVIPLQYHRLCSQFRHQGRIYMYIMPTLIYIYLYIYIYMLFILSLEQCFHFIPTAVSIYLLNRLAVRIRKWPNASAVPNVILTMTVTPVIPTGCCALFFAWQEWEEWVNQWQLGVKMATCFPLWTAEWEKNPGCLKGPFVLGYRDYCIIFFIYIYIYSNSTYCPLSTYP